MMTDPIADMLTRLRNALMARHDHVDIPASNVKTEIARILKDEGYIESYVRKDDDKQGILRIVLRHGEEDSKVVLGLQRVSRPGCRIYVGSDKIPRVQGGLGINILSTSRGVMTGRQAEKDGVGGEILCDVW